MSLINKMLQDLDARGSQGGEPMPGEIKSVPRAASPVATPVVVIALLSAGALAAAGTFGWRWYQQRAVAPAPLVVAAAPVPVAAPPALIVPAQMQAPVPAPAAPAPAPAPVSTPAPLEVAERAPPVQAPPARAAVPATKLSVQKPARQIEYWGERKAERKPATGASAVNHAPIKAPASGAREQAERGPDARPASPSAAQSGQRGEGEYRRALSALGEGRIGDAIAGLEQTLRLDPRHDAARQTLVGLLIEHRRPDDAMRQLQTALTQDPRQPSLAMLLARMQIERGVSGIDTLQRTLPSAAGNADYHAFLAGALQREGRNREAAEQFSAALRSRPQQGVWLMGLGISLQADKRNGEAVEAFERARASGNLSAELQAFVDRRLVQLAR